MGRMKYPPDFETVGECDSFYRTAIAVIVLVGIVGIMVTSCVDGTVRTAEIQEQHYSAPYTEFFRRHGSPEPEQMAKAVEAVKPENRPIIAAMAVVETGGNPKVRNSGWKKQHSGAWQVNPKWHGEVSNDPVKQALQAERILEDLLVADQRRSLRCALIKYNGGASPKGKVVAKRYANKVLKIKENM